MDCFAVELREELWGLIDRIAGDCRQLYVKDPCRDFTRKRKLPMTKMLRYLIRLQAKSLPHELGDLFAYSPNMPTVSAFTQQRAKLAEHTLPALFSVWNMAHQPRRMANGYQLIACDGSDVCFAGNSSEKGCNFETEDGRSFCLAHLNALQDVIGGTYRDAIIQDCRCANEIQAMIDMIERSPWDARTIFTADRAYECYRLMAQMK